MARLSFHLGAALAAPAAPKATVLGIACGRGRCMGCLAALGQQVTGVDSSPEALLETAAFSAVVLLDIANGPWLLTQEGKPNNFKPWR